MINLKDYCYHLNNIKKELNLNRDNTWSDYYIISKNIKEFKHIIRNVYLTYLIGVRNY